MWRRAAGVTRLLGAGALAIVCACGRVSYEGQGRAGDAAADAAFDGGESDTGPGGANDAAIDAPLDAVAGPLDCAARFPTALVCDAFDAIDPAWFQVREPPGAGGIVELDDRIFRSAPASLHTVAGPTGPSSSKLVGSFLDNRLSGDLYVRGWYRIAQPAYGVTLLHVVDTVSPFPGLVVQVTEGSAVNVFSTIEPGSGAIGGSVPMETWFCLQLEVHIHTNVGTARVLVDGVEVSALGPTSTVPTNGFMDIHAGIFVNETHPSAIDLWVDDLVADVVPVPCD